MCAYVHWLMGKCQPDILMIFTKINSEENVFHEFYFHEIVLKNVALERVCAYVHTGYWVSVIQKY